MVSGAINAIWQKSGAVDHRVNATKFRRAAVTAVREGAKELSEEAADLMGHMKGTADKVYHVRRKEINALQAAAEIGTLMRQKDHKEVTPETKQSPDAPGKRKRRSKEENDAIQELFAGKFHFSTLFALQLVNGC